MRDEMASVRIRIPHRLGQASKAALCVPLSVHTIRHWRVPIPRMVIASQSHRISSRQYRGGGATPAAGAPLERRPLIQSLCCCSSRSRSFCLLQFGSSGVEETGRSTALCLQGWKKLWPGASIYGCYVALVCVRGHTQVIVETLVSWRGKKKKERERRSGRCRCMHKLVTHIIPASIDCFFGWLVMQCHRRKSDDHESSSI